MDVLGEHVLPTAFLDRLAGATQVALDGQFLAFSRGPDSGGDPTKPGTHMAASEVHGVYAPGWNIAAVKVDRVENIRLSEATEADFCYLTTNGFSNKEPAWFRPHR